MSSYSKYNKQLLKDFESLPHQKMIDKYKPEEILRANKLSQRKKHEQSIDFINSNQMRRII